MKDLDKKIIQLYQDGYGQRAVAKAVHKSLRYIKRVLTENGIHIRSKSEAGIKAYQSGKRARRRVVYTPEQEQIVLDCYLNQKRGLEYCRKQAKISLTTVNAILKDNNIKKRTYAEAAVESNQNRALYKNKNYFDTQSPNMAWVLGFLAADGSVSSKDNSIHLGLSTTDREILERIQEEIEIENPIHDYTNRDGFKCSGLHWTCKEHKEQLARYSIVPKKTFILEPPKILDEKYYLDYIRGYFDGDGSVNFIKKPNGKGRLRWQVCSATPAILYFIVDVLESHGVPRVNVQKQQRGKNMNVLYVIQYSTQATKNIYKLLYSTESTLFLARKKEHFIDILKKLDK